MTAAPCTPRIHIGLSTHKIQTLFPEGTDDTFDFCTSCVEGSRDLFNQLLDSSPRGKFGNIGIWQLLYWQEGHQMNGPDALSRNKYCWLRGSNRCPLAWELGTLPLDHRGVDSSRIRIELGGNHKIQTIFPEGTGNTFDFCTSWVEGSRDLFNQLLDSTPRGKFGNILGYALGYAV